MKILIEKQYHKLGDEYMEQTGVEADVWQNGSGDIVIEMEDSQYKLPSDLVKGFNGPSSDEDKANVTILDRESVGQVKYIKP